MGSFKGIGRSKPPSILLVDDDQEICSGFSKGLSKVGFDTQWTRCPDHALALVREFSFDVVVLDLVMPKIWGIDLCSILHNEDPRLRCIILSGHTSIEHCCNAFKAGVSDFIEKPVTVAKLAERIHEILKPKGEFLPLINMLQQSGLVPPGMAIDAGISDLLIDPTSHQLKEFRHKTVYHYLKRASEICDGEPKKIASVTGCSIATVYRLMEQYSIPMR